MKPVAPIFSLVVLIGLWAMPLVVNAGTVWDLDLPVPGGDPLWADVAALWNAHWDEENIHTLIQTLHRLESKYPDKPDIQLWLARAYYLKSRYQGRDRVHNLKQSEIHAARALALDRSSVVAMKLLITSVSSYADLSYIAKTYGKLFEKRPRLPVGPALPPLDIPGFRSALESWNGREDIEKGLKAVAAFRAVADQHPENSLAQIWVARGNYYLGYYYLSMDQYDRGLSYFEEGNRYGMKALALSFHSVPANYWRQLNLARSIQNANIFVKAAHLKAIMGNLVFTANENMTYFYCGPLISTATIIEKGGWVAEKGVGMAGYNLDMVTTGLELAVMAYPTYFYIHFAKAEVLYHLGKKDACRKLLDQILEMDPHENPYHAAENLCTQRLVRLYIAEFF